MTLLIDGHQNRGVGYGVFFYIYCSIQEHDIHRIKDFKNP